MTKCLGESDRRAVDLLLDGSAGAGDSVEAGGYVPHVQPAIEPGIQAVQSVLSLLDLLPVADPPADLVTRAMSRIDARSGTGSPIHPAAASLTSRPHA